jgi:hypothetical protein
MAQIKIIRHLSEYLQAIRKSQFVLGLHDTITPCYAGQGGTTVKGFAAFATMVIAFVAATQFLAARGPAPLIAREAIVTLAELPANPVIPNLEIGGPRLEDMKVESVGDTRLLVASYRGPRGCLLDLRVSPLKSALPPAGDGSSRHGWSVGPLAYELVAHGMPGWRFAVIADAAELETRYGRVQDAVRRRLHEAHALAPRCR